MANSLIPRAKSEGTNDRSLGNCYEAICTGDTVQLLAVPPHHAEDFKRGQCYTVTNGNLVKAIKDYCGVPVLPRGPITLINEAGRKGRFAPYLVIRTAKAGQ